MKRHAPRISSQVALLVMLLVAEAYTPISATGTPDDLLSPDELIDALKQGGLVLYLRHSETDHSFDDRHPVDLTDCSTQRNLSEQGRNQAKSIADAITRLGIHIDEVLSSPFCRCRDTAQLAFGRYRADDNLYFAVVVDKEQRATQSEWLRQMLATPPKPGTNRAIVSHTANLREATGIWPKPEGVAWVILPKGNGQYQALGKIDPSVWPEAD